VPKAYTHSPARVSHLNRRIHLGIRLLVPRVEGMPFAQVLHWKSLGRDGRSAPHLSLRSQVGGFPAVQVALLVVQL
jgi:hypothetical protein